MNKKEFINENFKLSRERLNKQDFYGGILMSGGAIGMLLGILFTIDNILIRIVSAVGLSYFSITTFNFLRPMFKKDTDKQKTENEQKRIE